MANEITTTKFGCGQQATAMNADDRLVFGDGTGKEYWIKKADFAAVILPLLSEATITEKGLLSASRMKNELVFRSPVNNSKAIKIATITPPIGYYSDSIAVLYNGLFATSFFIIAITVNVSTLTVKVITCGKDISNSRGVNVIVEKNGNVYDIYVTGSHANNSTPTGSLARVGGQFINLVHNQDNVDVSSLSADITIAV